MSGADDVDRGTKLTAEVELDPADKDVKIEWTLYREQSDYGVQGTGAAKTAAFPEAIVKNGEPRVEVVAPESGGVYRLYCVLRNAHNGAAVGSLPLKVRGPAKLLKASVPKLPLVVYADGVESAPFAASGWMGNTKSLKMEPDHTEDPHSGKTCLRVAYDAKGDWASVVWQHPADDWGDRPGGYDLSAATELVFWARGKNGGEKITFGFGLLGAEKKYHDSAKKELAVTLGKEWKEYKLDLSETELIRIKSGFLWRLTGQGAPVEFYLDDIEYR
ncbi:MAG: hypothetical protein QM811_12360 [Pirellulales bacterium]